MDEALYLLTNRSGPYNSAAFPVFAGAWLTKRCAPEVEQVRELMQLHRRDTDYYVAWCLSLLEAHPDLMSAFEQRSKSYLLHEIPVELPVVVNGQLKAHGGIPPAVAVLTSSWPPVEQLALTLESTTMALQLGDAQLTVPVRRSGSSVYPDWPAEAGVAGRVEWQDTAVPVVIHFKPHVVPSVVRAAMRDSEAMQRLLTRYHLLHAFEETVNPARAVAIGLVALGAGTADGE